MCEFSPDNQTTSNHARKRLLYSVHIVQVIIHVWYQVIFANIIQVISHVRYKQICVKHNTSDNTDETDLCNTYCKCKIVRYKLIVIKHNTSHQHVRYKLSARVLYLWLCHLIVCCHWTVRKCCLYFPIQVEENENEPNIHKFDYLVSCDRLSFFGKLLSLI